jgi:uncharacterized membrane protein YcaP (DUF421 family)
MTTLFFDNWESVQRTLIITVLAYIALVLLLRISGKRTLSKMNAFDFIVTVALGSAFASVALTKNIALADGVLAFALFIGMQFIITWLSVRVPFVKHLITSRPTLLLYKGELIQQVVKKERITIDEIYVAVRMKGIGNLKDVDAIVLETTGDINVIPKFNFDEAQTFETIGNFPEIRNDKAQVDKNSK